MDLKYVVYITSIIFFFLSLLACNYKSLASFYILCGFLFLILYAYLKISDAKIEGDNTNKYTKVTRQVRKLCDKNNIEFLFITVGQSQWSVTKNKHIRDVVNFHKRTENKKGN